MMDKLQEAVLLAAKLREESYGDMMNSANRFNTPNYKKSLYACSKEAVESLGLDVRSIQLVYILLTSNWNESLDWANNNG